MSLPRIYGLAVMAATALALTTAVIAQSEPATVVPAEETAPAPVTELTDPHGDANPGDAAAGQGKAAVCAACHGMDGNSADPQYPKLAGQHERYTARHLALFKSGERENPIMLGFAAMLGPQDMRDVGAYFASLKALPGVADESVIRSGPNQGKKFYRVGETIYRGGIAARKVPACAGCHGPTGAGNPGPAYPALAGQHARYTADLLRRYRDGVVYGHGEQANLVMSGVAGALTDEEIESLASYIEGLHPSESAALPR